MTRQRIQVTLVGLMTLHILSCFSPTRQVDKSVKVIGAMRNVMRKGELSGTINLDTISNKEHLYGVGPVEYLAGELLIVDGKVYKSTVFTDSTMRIEEGYKAKAPFFVYANVYSWAEQHLPDSIQTVQQLEEYLYHVSQKSQRPFAFRLVGTVGTATIHVVNLPKGSKVSSPADAHDGQRDFDLQNEQAEIIGFFSTEHQGVFTHHDTYLHMHLLTADKSKMGHLDRVLLKSVKLYLPAD